VSETDIRIDIRNLIVDYGDVRAVDDVSLSVGRGELVTLLGPSGCGKTTTLRAVAGLEDPTGGSIALNALVYWRRRGATHRRRSAAFPWCSSPMRSGCT
jgi:ABC-type Fe3+/spermidine/putrescine transport system ATPase subunit